MFTDARRRCQADMPHSLEQHTLRLGIGVQPPAMVCHQTPSVPQRLKQIMRALGIVEMVTHQQMASVRVKRC